MYRGLHTVTMDAKGRFAMPARYRQSLRVEAEGCLIVTIDTEACCLLIYTLSEWEGIERKIVALSSFNPATRRIQRLLMGHASELNLDGHGRVLLPALLRQYAKIDRTAMLVGQGKKFELWDESSWQESRDQWLQEAGQKAGQLPEALADISL